MMASTVLGAVSSAAAGGPGEAKSTTQATQEQPELPTELWQEIVSYLPQDVLTLMRLRAVNRNYRDQMNAYLADHPRLWRLLPTEILNRVLNAQSVPKRWKEDITATVWVTDKIPVDSNDIENVSGHKKLFEQSSPFPVRVVENQQELDVALADPALSVTDDEGNSCRKIELVGNDVFDVSKATRSHMLRLRGSVQVKNLAAGLVYAHNASQVHNITSGKIIAFDEVQVHGVTYDEQNGPYEHPFVRLTHQAQLYGLQEGEVQAWDNAQIHAPSGGDIWYFQPSVRVNDPGKKVNVHYLGNVKAVAQ